MVVDGRDGIAVTAFGDDPTPTVSAHYRDVDSIHIETGPGFDSIFVHSIRYPEIRSLAIDAGHGRASIGVADVSVVDDVIITTGDDGDTLDIIQTGAGTGITIATAGGDDDLYFRTFSGRRSRSTPARATTA